MKVSFTNLGCKLNQAELERLAREFVAAGDEVVPDVRGADVQVINTCTVTHVAARSSRKVARRSKRDNPSIKTVLTGCWVASDPGEAAALAGVDLVVANHDKERLVARVREAFPGLAGSAASPTVPLRYVPLDFGHSRALVKVEDGCAMRCSFCIIPSTRGRQRSRPLPDVVEEVRGLVDGGYREVVVTGVQISHYRWEGRGLFELIQALLDDTELERLRLTSIAPWRFDPRLIDLLAGGRVCRHVHMSLQSGCDATLRRMRRPYTSESYVELVASIRRAAPGTAVTTDVIVGFPGETELEFERSLDFVARVGFAKIHAFPYSPRPGTEAATLDHQVAPEVRKERMDRMLRVAADSAATFVRDHVGRRAVVLWERRRPDRRWQGTTDNYLRVLADDDRHLHRQLSSTELVGREGDDVLLGRIVDRVASGPGASALAAG